jgi:hypothetical protein
MTRLRGLLVCVATAAALLASAVPANAGLLGGGGLLGGKSTVGEWTLGGVPCRLIGVPAAAPVGTAACPGVRPGAIVESDVGQCTFNFLFQGSDGRRYMGTAGHCILGDDPLGGDAGERTWAPGAGPVARDGDGNRIGEFAYAILQDPKDISLIRLDPSVAASPQMCHFGGPTGVNSDQGADPVVLHHFGQGIGVGTALPGRSALAIGTPNADHVYAQGAVVPGDSGSGIISDDGRAVGVIVTTGIHTNSIGTDGVDAGLMGITRLAPQIARAQQVMGIGLTLQQAPTL